MVHVFPAVVAPADDQGRGSRRGIEDEPCALVIAHLPFATHGTPPAGHAPSHERTTTAETRLLFSATAYGPENLQRICRAFDQAWAAIEPVVEDNALAREAAQLKLANMLLGVASNDKLDQARATSPMPQASPDGQVESSA